MPDLRRIFIEPRSSDEDARRREYILNIILIGSIIMLVILDGMNFFDAIYQPHPLASILSYQEFAIFPAFFILLYVLSRRGFFVLASYLLIAAYFIGTTYASYRWGVNVPTALVGYALLIVIASILISTRFAFFVAGAIAIVVLPLWYAQLHGLMLTDAEHFTDGDGVALVVLYGLITLVAWLSNREIEKSLRRARTSERELKEERDLLEVKVEERTHELRMAQLEKIDHLYRFAEFGQLASGLFHDLLNVLNVAALRIEKNDDPASKSAKATLENAFGVHGEIERFRDAMRQQLSRDDAREPFSLIESVDNAIQLLDYQAKHENVRVIFDRGENAPLKYFGTKLKFHQVIVNLVLNAIDSFKSLPSEPDHGRHVVIRLGKEGEYIVLKVEDNGSGIPTELQSKIFEPFFTTKSAGKGTGIGLAITKRIVEKDFGGTITVESAEGRGSTFTVRFPLKS